MPHRLRRIAVALVCTFFTACVARPTDDPTTRARGAGADASTPRGIATPTPSATDAPADGGRAGAPVDFTSSRPPPEKLALLIGIDRYAPGTPDAFQKLQGCVRDVERVRRILEQRFGFAAEDILTLADERATHENIVRAFREWLIGRATADTEVVFWYSGHGSRVPDRSGVEAAELERKDSTLVAYDSRAHGENGAFDVSDDELRSLVFALTRKSSRVTIVTDSCHSGGVTRGARDNGPRVRGVDEGTRAVDFARLRASFWPADVALTDEDAATAVESDRYVHIAACTSAQSAQEIDTVDEKGAPEAHGALTFFLTRCLDEARPRTTYRELADDTAVRLSSRIPSQNVLREGALDRQLFGARFEARPAGFLCAGLPEGDLRVEAGSFHGLQRDSVLAIHDPRREVLVGRARVTRAGALSSIARWIDPPPSEIPTTALRAVEETRPDRIEPLSIFIADAELARALASSTRVRIETHDARRADYRLEMDGDDDTLTLFAPGGLKLWKRPRPGAAHEPELASTLEDTFREELRYQAIVALGEIGGSLRMETEFVPADRAKLDGYARERRVRDALPRRGAEGRSDREFDATGTLDPAHEYSLAVLRVRNPTARDVFLSVFSASEDRARNLIWPVAGARDNVLPAGGERSIDVSFVAHPKWDRARPMRDRYLVIATLEPADFSPLTYPPQLRSADAARSPMPELLATALEKETTRGAHSVRTDATSFGVTVVDVWVARPDEP